MSKKAKIHSSKRNGEPRNFSAIDIKKVRNSAAHYHPHGTSKDIQLTRSKLILKQEFLKDQNLETAKTADIYFDSANRVIAIQIFKGSIGNLKIAKMPQGSFIDISGLYKQYVLSSRTEVFSTERIYDGTYGELYGIELDKKV